MRPAVLKAMLLGLIRDPAALAMGFVLPAAVFLIFALIFAGASGGSLAIRLAVLDLERSDASERFVDGVRAHPQIDVVSLAEGTSPTRRSTSPRCATACRSAATDSPTSQPSTSPSETPTTPMRRPPASTTRPDGNAGSSPHRRFAARTGSS